MCMYGVYLMTFILLQWNTVLSAAVFQLKVLPSDSLIMIMNPLLQNLMTV